MIEAEVDQMTVTTDSTTQLAEAIKALVAEAVQTAMDQAVIHLAPSVPARQVTVRSGADLSTWMTVGQVSDTLACSETMVRNLARAGKLTGRKIGRTWRFDPASVESYMRNPGAA